MLQQLEVLLAAAPDGAWQSAGCSYGLVIQVLQAAEQALRQVGLHCSGDQLQQLAVQFLRQREHLQVSGGGDGSDAGGERGRRAQVPQLPKRKGGVRRRQVPQQRTPLPLALVSSADGDGAR